MMSILLDPSEKDVIAAVYGGAALLAAMWGLLVLTQVTTPGLTQRCVRTLSGRRFLSFVAGLPIAAVILVAGHAVEDQPKLGIIWFAAVTPVVLLGIASSAEELGRRVLEVSGRDGTRLRNMTIGWAVFALASGVPYVGWFVAFPFLLASGLGALVVPPLAPPAWTPGPANHRPPA